MMQACSSNLNRPEILVTVCAGHILEYIELLMRQACEPAFPLMCCT